MVMALFQVSDTAFMTIADRRESLRSLMIRNWQHEATASIGQ
jgi:hypothetical protein